MHEYKLTDSRGTLMVSLVLKFKVKLKTVLQCWKLGCGKLIKDGEWAYAFRRNRRSEAAAIRDGFIWCESCAKTIIGDKEDSE